VKQLSRRVLLVPAVAGVVTAVGIALPATALAHVEATASPGAQAGGQPLTVQFSAENEHPDAGITAIKTQLDQGVLPQWISLDSGPDGWALTTTADGYTVTGPALPAGEDAEYTIRVGQLPADRTTFTFKTLVDYSDGSEDAWIEVPSPGAAEPESPAPQITVAAAPSSAAATTTAPAGDTTSAAAPSAAPSSVDPATASSSDDGGSSTGLVVGAVVVVALAALLAGLWARRRSNAGA
jgi:hypothetical protein